MSTLSVLRTLCCIPNVSLFFDIPEHINFILTWHRIYSSSSHCTRDLYQPNGTRASNLPIYGAICHESTRRPSETGHERTKKMLLRTCSTSTLKIRMVHGRRSEIAQSLLHKMHVASGYIKTRKITEQVDTLQRTKNAGVEDTLSKFFRSSRRNIDDVLDKIGRKGGGGGGGGWRGGSLKLKASLLGTIPRAGTWHTHPCRRRGTPAEVVLWLALSLIWSPSALSRIQSLSYSFWRDGRGRPPVSWSRPLPSLSPRPFLPPSPPAACRCRSRSSNQPPAISSARPPATLLSSDCFLPSGCLKIHRRSFRESSRHLASRQYIKIRERTSDFLIIYFSRCDNNYRTNNNCICSIV